MSKSKLYSALIRSIIKDTVERMKKESAEKEMKQVENNIKNLVSRKNKHLTREDAMIYLEIMKEEYPLFMCMTDYDIINLIKEELEVEMTYKLLSMIMPKPRSNPYYELIILT